MATLQTEFAQRQKDSNAKIGDLYDKQYQSQAVKLKNAYDQNVSNQQVEQAKIAPAYQQQANKLAVNYERQRRNANLQAMNSGMGSGTAVQQNDAFNRAYQMNYGGLRAQEAQAQADAAQKIADLGVAYRGNLTEAQASAEAAKAQALVKEQNSLNDWYDAQAKQMAAYGDFSAYEKLYGTAAANQMKEVWIIQNPETALGAGMINKKRYKEITGHDPGQK